MGSKEISFANAEQYRKVTQTGERIRDMLMKMRHIDPHRQFKETVDKFRDSLSVMKNHDDEGALPFVSHDAMSREKNSMVCLYAAISRVVLLFWDLQKEVPYDQEVLDGKISFLESVAELGNLSDPKIQVAGEYPNYRLTLLVKRTL